jgi:hypothetical protein
MTTKNIIPYDIYKYIDRQDTTNINKYIRACDILNLEKYNYGLPLREYKNCETYNELYDEICKGKEKGELKIIGEILNCQYRSLQEDNICDCEKRYAYILLDLEDIKEDSTQIYTFERIF